MAQIANCIGMLGVFILLVAYFLLQYGKLSSNHITYSFLNLTGSLLILYSLFFAWNLPAVIIEIAWALISLYGIIKILLKRTVDKKR